MNENHRFLYDRPMRPGVRQAMHVRLLIPVLLAALLLLPERASAGQLYAFNQVISDGKDGRVWRQWVQQIADRPVTSVSVRLRRQSGGGDTFVNLRYGSNGAAFENGKQVFLRDGATKTVSWNVGGERPSSRPLVLNAYKGEVFVESITVNFQ